MVLSYVKHKKSGKQLSNHNPLKLNNFGCSRHSSSKLGSALGCTKFAVEPRKENRQVGQSASTPGYFFRKISFIVNVVVSIEIGSGYK
jgi:hypothetical protein